MIILSRSFSPDDWSELGETVMQSCALRSILFPLSGPYAYKIKSISPSCHIPSPSIRLILLIPQPSRQSPDGFHHTKNVEVSELQILPHWRPDGWRFFWKKWINWILWLIWVETVGLSVGFPVGLYSTFSNANIRFKTTLPAFTCEQHPVE